MFEKERFSPGSQLAILLMLVGVCFIIGAFATVYAGALTLHLPFSEVLSNPKLIIADASAARLSQAVGTFFMFALPVFIFAYIVNKRRPFNYVGFNTVASGKQAFYTVLIAMAALWVSGALGLLNSLIPLTQKTAAYFKQLEDEYMKEATAMISLKDTAGYILSLVMIALLPAMFEEIFFRGCLQKVLIAITRNAFLGIFITSILFSAIHFSYYGFLSRLFLGLLLGYLYYYSKNIWFNIFAHFFNNAFAITMAYIWMQRGKTVKDALTDSDFTTKMALYNTLFAGLIFGAALFFLLKAFRRESEVVLAAHQPPALPINNETNTIL